MIFDFLSKKMIESTRKFIFKSSVCKIFIALDDLNLFSRSNYFNLDSIKQINPFVSRIISKILLEWVFRNDGIAFKGDGVARYFRHCFEKFLLVGGGLVKAKL